MVTITIHGERRQVEQGTTEYVVKMERQKPASPQPQKCSFISQGV